jgi:hypothetical protein
MVSSAASIDTRPRRRSCAVNVALPSTFASHSVRPRRSSSRASRRAGSTVDRLRFSRRATSAAMMCAIRSTSSFGELGPAASRPGPVPSPWPRITDLVCRSSRCGRVAAPTTGARCVATATNRRLAHAYLFGGRVCCAVVFTATPFTTSLPSTSSTLLGFAPMHCEHDAGGPFPCGHGISRLCALRAALRACARAAACLSVRAPGGSASARSSRTDVTAAAQSNCELAASPGRRRGLADFAGGHSSSPSSSLRVIALRRRRRLLVGRARRTCVTHQQRLGVMTGLELVLDGRRSSSVALGPRASLYRRKRYRLMNVGDASARR